MTLTNPSRGMDRRERRQLLLFQRQRKRDEHESKRRMWSIQYPSANPREYVDHTPSPRQLPRRRLKLTLAEMSGHIRYMRGVERDGAYSVLMGITGENPMPMQLVRLGAGSKASARRYLKQLRSDADDNAKVRQTERVGQLPG